MGNRPADKSAIGGCLEKAGDRPRVRCGAGPAGLHSPGPALAPARGGGYFGVTPALLPSGASPRSFPRQSPVSPHPF